MTVHHPGVCGKVAAVLVIALQGWCVAAGLEVTVGTAGLRLTHDGHEIGSGAQWLSVCDLATGDAFVPVAVAPRGAGFGGRAAELDFEGEWKPVGEGAELTCRLTANPPRDRAVVVRVSLPLDAVGWTWWDDLEERRVVEAPKTYSKLQDWYGTWTLSWYPLCAVSGPTVGVSMAVPLNEPTINRLSYDGPRRALQAEFDVGLSPDATRLPARAQLRLIVYPHDPRIGFRDALQRYAERFPAYSRRRVGEAGIWLLGLNPRTMACPWDWGFCFDEGGETRAGYDCAHDILPFVYTEPWGKYESFPGPPTPDGKPRYDEKAPMLSAQALRQSVLQDLNAPPEQADRHFGKRRDIARADANSAIERQDGSWVWRHWTDEWSPGRWLSNLTLDPDPELPEPNRASVTWQYELDPGAATAKATGGELAGVYLDSVSGFMGFYNEDFRREHWRTADTPLVAGHGSRKPSELHAFECLKLARQVAERMGAQGKYVMGNTGRPEMQPFCQFLDMIGAGETGSCGLAGDDHYRYLRTYAFGKPLSWMDYGFVKPAVPWAEKERGLQRCLFYAVHPGTGSFDTPASYEPSRPLFRYYEPLITWLDAAGWQPVTHATASAPGVLVERYGPGSGRWAAVSFIALRNPGRQAAEATVSVEPEALPAEVRGAGAEGASVIAWRLVQDRPVTVQPRGAGGVAVGAISLAPDATEVVAVGGRDALARLWLEEAARWLEHEEKEARWLGADGGGTVLRNGNFEAGLGGWGTDTNAGKEGEVLVDQRAPLAGKASLLARSLGNNAFQALFQDVSLPSGTPYTLRFKYAWVRPPGAAGTVVPRFGVKGPDGQWAADKYLYFNDLQPTGEKVATYERTFSVPDKHTAGFFQFLFQGQWGTIRLDDVEILSPAIEDMQRRLAGLPKLARAAAESLRQSLAQQPGDLLAASAAMEPAYRQLVDLAGGLSDEYTRRCLTLPLQGFAEALGRATEVLCDVTLGTPEGPPFVDAALGGTARLPCTVRAGATAVRFGISVEGEAAPMGGLIPLPPRGEVALTPTAAAPAAAPWGWHDVMLAARFQQGGRQVWVPRRFTLRLHPPLDVSAAGPVSSVRAALPLALRSWLPEGAPVRLTGSVKGAPELTLDPLEAQVQPGGAQRLDWPLASAAPGKLEELARAGATLRVQWEAATGAVAPARGELEAVVVRGATCPILATAPKIDGRVDPGEWAGAARLEGFVLPQSGQAAPRATTVLLGRDRRNLYVAFLCDGQPNPAARDRARDGAVWEDDAVEVFIQPPGSQTYYHLAANARGVQYDARCTAGGNAPGWNADWEVRTGTTATGWVAELAVPLAALGGEAPGPWRMNFGREEADTGRATCWNPTLGGFHVPERFGEVVFTN